MLKVPDELDQVLVAKTYEAEQEHVFRSWSKLEAEQQRALLDQLRQVDFQLLRRLTKLIDRGEAPPHTDLAPVQIATPSPRRRAKLAVAGWEALARGEVALLMVAGGHGTRLGWDAPKERPAGWREPVTHFVSSMRNMGVIQIRRDPDGRPRLQLELWDLREKRLALDHYSPRHCQFRT